MPQAESTQSPLRTRRVLLLQLDDFGLLEFGCNGRATREIVNCTAPAEERETSGQARTERYTESSEPPRRLSCHVFFLRFFFPATPPYSFFAVFFYLWHGLSSPLFLPNLGKTYKAIPRVPRKKKDGKNRVASPVVEGLSPSLGSPRPDSHCGSPEIFSFLSRDDLPVLKCAPLRSCTIYSTSGYSLPARAP